MLLPCPNCGFPVALVTPNNGANAQRCPRCGDVLAGADVDAAPSPRGGGRGADTSTGGAPDAGTHTGPNPQFDDRAKPQAGTEHRVPIDSSPSHTVRVHTADATSPAGRLDRTVVDTASPDNHGRDAPRVADAPATHSDAASGMTPMQSQSPSVPSPGPGRPAPSFVRRTRSARGGRRWPLHVASAVLALVLALQLVLAQRGALATDARWRPAVETLCGVLGCTVPAWREPSAFTMIDRSVQPKPGTPGVLTARASFRNDARWPQSWPTLVLTLSGVDGEPLGARAFTPAEYNGGAHAPLAPGQSASVQVDVVEPGPGVVAFAFDFR